MSRRAKGHKLTVEWSGEYGENSSSTGTCPCGWEESGSSQAVVRQEYRWHLDRVRADKERKAQAEVERLVQLASAAGANVTAEETL